MDEGNRIGKRKGNIKMACVVLGVRDLSLLASRIPSWRVEQVSAGKEHIQLPPTEIAHRLCGSTFHLDREASVSFSPCKVALGLTVKGIGRPCLAHGAWNAVSLHEALHDGGIGDIDVVSGRHVVVGGTLVAIGSSGDDHLAAGNFLVQTAAATKQDIFVGIDLRDRILDGRDTGGRANSRLEKAKVLPLCANA